MSLRSRIAVIAAVAVAIAVLATSVGVYAATARTLQAGTDRELAEIAEDLTRRRANPPGRGTFTPGARPGAFGGPGGFIQVVTPDGTPLGGAATLPVSDRTKDAATRRERAPSFYESAEVDDVSVRVLNVPVEVGVLQIALPTETTDEALTDLRRQLALGSLAGIVFAALLGLAVARRAIRPVHDLTELAEDVAQTGDLTRRIDAGGDDEVGRLARTFNGMLASLEQARASQQQLVADASHELRTPLTSLRTNIEVLEHSDRLPDAARRDLMRDVLGQLEEFGRLVDGLVELARGAQPARGATTVRLDEVAESAVERLRTFARDREFVLTTQPSTVLAESDRLDRAVANLIDNAVKYGRGAVEVDVREGTVTVRDHGEGIDPDHLDHVFDRFYRAPEARAAPGSGLGLSIVQQVAHSHGGEVSVANAPGGGAVFTLHLPEIEPDRTLVSADA